jgi:hypothetical protein
MDQPIINLAKPSDRILAAIIDALIAGLIQFSVGITLWVIGLGWLGAFLGVAYMIVRDNLVFLNYQSIGKKILKIKVISKKDNGPIDLLTSFKRNLIFLPALLNSIMLNLIYISGSIMVIWLILELYKLYNTTQNQRLGDEFADTLVLKEG